MEIEPKVPLVFAHRGASAHAPENTLAAFEMAIQQKADYIELDAKLTRDQQVVVIHDRTVERTTDGLGVVSDIPLAALRELNASHNFQTDFPRQAIPTLDEVFQLCRGNIRINIELSNYFTPFDHLPEMVADLINRYQEQDNLLVSAFHPVPLRKLHRLCPNIRLGFLARQGIQGYLSRGWLGRALVQYDALHPEKSDVTAGLVRTARKLSHKINPFTVNDPREMAKLISLGVDGLITDDPQLARQVIASMQYHNP